MTGSAVAPKAPPWRARSAEMTTAAAAQAAFLAAFAEFARSPCSRTAPKLRRDAIERFVPVEDHPVAVGIHEPHGDIEEGATVQRGCFQR